MKYEHRTVPKRKPQSDEIFEYIRIWYKIHFGTKLFASPYR